MRERASLPESWVWARLRDVASPSRSRNPKADGEGEFLYVDIEALDNTTQRITSPKRMRNPEAPSRARVQIKSGDVLFSLVRPYLKNIAKVPEELDGQIASTAFCLLRPETDINDSFLFHYLTQESFINAMPTYGNSPPAARDDEFYDMTVPVPPPAEQRRIVAAIEEQFSRLGAGVSALERVQANLKRYRTAVIKAAVEGRLTESWREENPDVEPASELLKRILKERRDRWEKEQLAAYEKGKKPPRNWRLKYKEPAGPDTENLPDLPRRWCWTSAEQVCGFITKGTTPSADKLHSGSGDVPFIKVYNLTFDGSLNFRLEPTFISTRTNGGELLRSRLFPGDVLMNIVGPPLGKVSIVPALYPEWNMNQAIAVFRPMPSYNREFLCFSLLSESVLSWARRRAKATAGQLNLTLEICRNLPLPLPPLAEQEQLVSEVKRRLSILWEVEAEVETNMKRASRLRQAILKRAFEGELVPQDPSDEPASELLERIRREREQASSKKPKRRTRRKGTGEVNPAGHAGTLF